MRSSPLKKPRRKTPPGTWVPVGDVVIAYRGGQIRVVSLFRTGGGPGAYQVTGPAEYYGYYRGSSDEEIAGTLAACLQRAADRPAE